MDVSKNRDKTPKMDGENNGKPYFLMDDLGVPLFSETPICTFFALALSLFQFRLLTPNLSMLGLSLAAQKPPRAFMGWLLLPNFGIPHYSWELKKGAPPMVI